VEGIKTTIPSTAGAPRSRLPGRGLDTHFVDDSGGGATSPGGRGVERPRRPPQPKLCLKTPEARRRGRATSRIVALGHVDRGADRARSHSGVFRPASPAPRGVPGRSPVRMRVRVELTPRPGPGSSASRGLAARPAPLDGGRHATCCAPPHARLRLQNGARRVRWRPRGRPSPAAGGSRRRCSAGSATAAASRASTSESPAEYGFESWRGARSCSDATNGSIALRSVAPLARMRLTGAFVKTARRGPGPGGRSHVLLVCAGKLGGFALEDAAFAVGCARDRSAGARIEGGAARWRARWLRPIALQCGQLVQARSTAIPALAGPEYAATLDCVLRLDRIDRRSSVKPGGSRLAARLTGGVSNGAWLFIGVVSTRPRRDETGHRQVSSLLVLLACTS